MGLVDVTRFNLYTPHALEPAVPAAVMLALSDAGMCEVSWHLSRPPIAGLEAFRIDRPADPTFQDRTGATLELDLVGDVEETVDGEIAGGQLGNRRGTGARQAVTRPGDDEQGAKLDRYQLLR